ncbi:RDD family protein [Egibacter rhizosphaerae]|uniref:RDD family protein n=1 Tax=Egibacter rhizosphaerae TaxID=1670831 RepID=UPI0013F15EE3|nr:RDD family protein [Egibacter rhizosphaerae]
MASDPSTQRATAGVPLPTDGVGGEVVTPEAVRLGFADATIATRGIAAIVDFLIMGVLMLVTQLAVVFGGPALGAAEWLGPTAAIVLVFLMLFGYPTAFESLWRGRTPGKAMLGLQVLTVEGSPIGFRHAAIRAAIGLVELRVTSGLIAVIVSVLSRRGQRLGDHAAGTVVVRAPSARRRVRAMVVDVPPGLEGFAHRLDPTGATGEDYRAARTFLERREQLTAQARADLASRIASEVGPRVGVVPDARVSAEDFLVCFVARYQQHEQARPDGA